VVLGADFCFDDGCKQRVAGGVASATPAQSQDMDVNYYDAAGG
jgi:hypothetical protein